MPSTPIFDYPVLVLSTGPFSNTDPCDLSFSRRRLIMATSCSSVQPPGYSDGEPICSRNATTISSAPQASARLAVGPRHCDLCSLCLTSMLLDVTRHSASVSGNPNATTRYEAYLEQWLDRSVGESYGSHIRGIMMSHRCCSL